MNLVEQCRDRKIHTRSIKISTYEYDEENMVFEGILKDDLLIPIYVSGKKNNRTHHIT